MASSDKMTKETVRKLAAEGGLVATCFEVFRKTVFPGLPPQLEGDFKIAFFAGAAELYSLFMACLDEGDDATDGDEFLMTAWVTEMEAFQRATLSALMEEQAQNNSARPAYDA